MVGESSRPSAMENLENYKKIFGYSNPPFPAIGEVEFVKYIKDTHEGKTVAQVLKDLLGLEVRMFSTRCINSALRVLYGKTSLWAKIMTCLHDDDPDIGDLTCFNLYVRNYHSPRLVVCTMRDGDLHAKYPGRIVVTPDADRAGGIMIYSVATSYVNKSPPPEIAIMNDYKRWFGYTAPFPTICEPEFVQYFQELGKSETSALEYLLGGRVELFSTPCINRVLWGNYHDGEWDATVKECGHTGQNAAELNGASCMKEFVRNHPSRQLVVCTMAARGHYARVPGRIVVTPDGRDGIMIDTVPAETIAQHVKWFLRVKRYQLNVFERLRKEILAQKSGSSSIHMRTQEPRMKLLVVAKNGEGAEKSYFSSAVDASKKILEISSASGAMNIDDTDDSEKEDVSIKLQLSTSIQGDEEPVTIIVEKPDEIPFPTINKSVKVKKPGYDMVDVSPRLPEVDVAEKIGDGVTAEAQSLFDALSKTFSVRWDKTDIVVMNEVRVSSLYLLENVCGGTHKVNEHVRKVVQIQNEIRRLQTSGAGQGEC